MAQDPKSEPEVPMGESPAPPTTPPADAPKKRKLTLDIDEVDVSEVLERKISA